MEKEFNIAQLILNGGVLDNVEGKTPEEIYRKVCDQISVPDGVTSDEIYAALCAREQVLSTAVGNGIALPHARSPILKNEDDQRIIVVYLKNPIDMKAPDDRLVSVMFILLTQNTKVHLQVLSSLVGLFRNARFKKALEIHAKPETLFGVIKEIENN